MFSKLVILFLKIFEFDFERLLNYADIVDHKIIIRRPSKIS